MSRNFNYYSEENENFAVLRGKVTSSNLLQSLPFHLVYGCPIHCRIACTNWMPVATKIVSVITKNVSRHCHMCPGKGRGSPRLRTAALTLPSWNLHWIPQSLRVNLVHFLLCLCFSLLWRREALLPRTVFCCWAGLGFFFFSWQTASSMFQSPKVLQSGRWMSALNFRTSIKYYTCA